MSKGRANPSNVDLDTKLLNIEKAISLIIIQINPHLLVNFKF